MDTFTAPIAIGWRRLLIFSTVVGALALAPISGASPICKKQLSSHLHALPLSHRTTRIFGKDIPITVVENRQRYMVASELPHLENALLVHIDSEGHAMLWYDGRRVDSVGVPLIRITSLVRTVPYLAPGVVFAIHNLPPNFQENFRDFIAGFRRSQSRTCITAVCRRLNELNILAKGGQHILRPSALMKYFLTMDEAEAQRLGLEVIALGDNLKQNLTQYRILEKQILVSWATLLGPPTAALTLLEVLRFIF